MIKAVSPYIPPVFKPLLRLLYRKYFALIERFDSKSQYERRIVTEKREYLEIYQDQPVDALLLEPAPASWGYTESAVQNLIRDAIGYSQYEYIVNRANQIQAPEMLSLGTGPCGIEISLAEQITSKYHYHCMDLNEQVLAIGKRQIDKKGLNITVQAMDLNFVTLEQEKHDIITAFASLHHLSELERIYAAINGALKQDGIFVTLDVITRNGLMMWPETYEVVKKLWTILPDKYKINRTRYPSPCFTPTYQNVDYSQGSFEAIRSQDLLPLIPEFFDPIIYVPFHSLCRQLLDTQYGPNYDLDDPLDRSMVEFIWNLDCYYVRERILPPGTMFSVMRKKGTADSKVVTEVTARMLADSRSRQQKWIAPPYSQRVNLKTSNKKVS